MFQLHDGNLELHFSAQGLRVQVLERPGLWMPEGQLRALVGSLREVARGVLHGKDLDYGVLGGDQELLCRCLVTLITDQRLGRAAGFNIMPMLPVSLYGREETLHHLGLAMVDPDYQQRGLTWLLYGLTSVLILSKNRFRPLWISSVTQVPAVFGKVAEGYRDVFPSSRTDARRTYTQLGLARGLMERHRSSFGVGPEAGFDEERFVITNAYTGGSDNLKKSYEEAPKHRDEGVNAFCRESLDYSRGDDFLQIGGFDLAFARRYLSREVPRRSLLGLGLTLGSALLAGLVAPLMQWLDVSHPFGILRPRH